MVGLLVAWVAGFMGVVDADAHRVQVFLGFCWAKLLVMLVVFSFDCYSLSKCGLGATMRIFFGCPFRRV